MTRTKPTPAAKQLRETAETLRRSASANYRKASAAALEKDYPACRRLQRQADVWLDRANELDRAFWRELTKSGGAR